MVEQTERPSVKEQQKSAQLGVYGSSANETAEKKLLIGET